MTDRELAFDTIYSIFFENRLCHEALKDALDRADSDKNSSLNKAWVGRLVNGVTETWLTLSYAIALQSGRKPEKIKPRLRVILNMAVYQACYMNVPESAAVNEAVKLCKKKGFIGLAGFVNGVLRGLFRNISSAGLDFISYIKEKCESLDRLSRYEIIYSVPGFMLEIFLESMSEDEMTVMLEEMLHEEKTISVYRLGTKCSKEEFEESLRLDHIDFRESENVNGAYILKPGFIGGSDKSSGKSGVQIPERSRTEIGTDESRVKKAEHPANREKNLTELTAWKKGWFIVQDVSSMLASELIPLNGIYKVIDVCAAPGGKTIHLADRLMQFHQNVADNENSSTAVNTAGNENSSTADNTANIKKSEIIDITACDISRKKTAKIEENLKRTNFGFIKTKVADASVFCEEYAGAFDAVIADLPCSGLGVIGRKPDIKYKTKKEDIDSLAGIQKNILSNVTGYVRENGILAFSTCTLSRAENEENASFIEKLGFEKLTEKRILPGNGRDGFYISVFRKK